MEQAIGEDMAALAVGRKLRLLARGSRPSRGGAVYKRNEAEMGAIAGDGEDVWRPASLSHAQILPGGAPRVIARARTLAERFDTWREDVSGRLAAADLAPDLAEAIGSRRWFRGLGTLIGLSALALAFWPDFAPVEAAPAMTMTESARDEFRSQMIMPLALGADSGRRMGATERVVPLRAAPERPRVELLATLARGDSFTRMLQRAGVGTQDASRVADLVARSIALDAIEPGTQVDITLGRRPQPGAARPLDSLAFRARFDLELEIARDAAGNLSLTRKPIRVDDTPLRIRGTVGSSLYRSMRAAGAPAARIER